MGGNMAGQFGSGTAIPTPALPSYSTATQGGGITGSHTAGGGPSNIGFSTPTVPGGTPSATPTSGSSATGSSAGGTASSAVSPTLFGGDQVPGSGVNNGANLPLGSAGGTMYPGGNMSGAPPTGGSGALNTTPSYSGASSTEGQTGNPSASTFFGGNPSEYAPFQANQNLASNIASFGSQSLPGAAAFEQNLFDPGFNPAEQAYMGNQASIQSTLLNQQMGQLGAQFSGTPFSSGYLNSADQLGIQAAQNLDNSGLQLEQARQGEAATAAGGLVGNPLAASTQAMNDTSGMFSLIQGLQNAPLSLGESYLNASPVIAPTVVPGAQTTSGTGSAKK